MKQLGSQYENASWFKKIQQDSDSFKRLFLKVTLAIGLLIPLSVAIASLVRGEYWNLPALAIAEAALAIAFLVSLMGSRRALNRLCAAFLVSLPFFYLWGSLSRGSHQTYIFVLLCMPLIFNVLATPESYVYWLAYAISFVALAGAAFLAGVPSMWTRDFNLGGILVIHSAFLALWVMRYVTHSQMLRFIDRLADQVLSDPVTGLPSIVALRKRDETKEPKLLCIVTIGNFWDLSTIFGYSFVENVLALAAERLAGAVASLGGTAYKLRHNDFAWVKPIPDRGAARELVKMFHLSLLGAFTLRDKTIELSYRIGYSIDSGGDMEKALDEANEAVRIAMEGGEVIAEYRRDEDRAAKVTEAAADLVTLSRNMMENSLALYYQPVIALSENRVAWNEALIRFRSLEGRYMPPGNLMDLAATTGHWPAIEDFVLESAAKWAAGPWGAVSLNAGLRDLGRDVFRVALEKAARCAREAGSVLILELLEGDFGAADRREQEAIESFRKAGGLVAIDDFGMGYSNYARLSSSLIDIVKFDKSLVNLALTDKAIAKLMVGLAEFCSRKGMLTVAEGVETEECAEFIATMGFDFGQGYYWARPVPEHEAAKAQKVSLLAPKPLRASEKT